jgi:hypothetical protein
MAKHWEYSIEAYRRSLDGCGWMPAKEAEASAWFGFRVKGEDHRCFGVFPSRRDAERAMEILKNQERERGFDRGMEL